ncbi:aspartate aminotransferase family protein [Leucobacter chinensis]|uniref:aspartate aminotransferase family protein n=1 Tax=Leucobacter chinensis TaxID=2851010 RepID=UPI001C247F22|nr:aminotransferase class III-fold pyridoxal phosphate-dependent enzyme [Leucobacter chinensis]
MNKEWVSSSLTEGAVEVAEAQGSIVTTTDGLALIDFVSGISCVNFGHRFAPVVEAIHEQAQLFLHQFMIIGQHKSYGEVCRLLSEVSPCRRGTSAEGEQHDEHPTGQKSILSTTGAEAVENAVKIARTATGRTGVISFDRSFHGRTLLGMSLSGFTRYKKGFGPFAPDIYQAEAPYPYRGVSDERALRSFVDMFVTRIDPNNVACVIIEPVQGEGGLIPMSPEFLTGVREICDMHGILLVFDETQTGLLRTGNLWAADSLGVQPDLLISGGSLGGGLPLSAVTGRAQLLDAVRPGGLGGTFSGTPMSTAAAVAMLTAAREEPMMLSASRVEERLSELVTSLCAEHESIGEARQLGPFFGLEFVRSREAREPDPELVARVIRRARDNGLLIDYCGAEKNILRLIPAVNIPNALLERGMRILSEAIAAENTIERR